MSASRVEIAWSVAKAAAADGDVLPDGARDFLVGQLGELTA